MTEPRMPTTLPSSVDRYEFRFVAVDAAGAAGERIDRDMVWVRVAEKAEPEGGAKDGSLTRPPDRCGARGLSRASGGNLPVQRGRPERRRVDARLSCRDSGRVRGGAERVPQEPA